MIKTSKAISKYLRLSPNKVRRILDQIRGKNYQEALLILQFMPYKPCNNIKKTLESAASNLGNINKKDLTIIEAYANQGPKIKRIQPRAQGRAFPIHKPTCHITIKLQ
uniref:Large ribosomal subunit protein uL22c n=2 Tax=Gelidium TaxID=2811 RepID=A0A411FTD9_9FLOR|nr:ribosomal protein L22 [Gelidium coulteri]YP_009565372.1 ribosomal protein L22 [Gelidium sinicola]QBA96323.1 ribosomal protein L22 [Gelidium coulteri]QBA96723.1 ribosomal protein L22 [Gelidium sinicola]